MKLSFCILLISITSLYSSEAASQSTESSCTDQSLCLTTNITQIISDDYVQYIICLVYNTTLPNCNAQTPIDYGCTSPTSPIHHALHSNQQICQMVNCDDNAIFALKDGQGCQLNSDLSSVTLGAISDISCNYPTNGVNYCSGQSDKKKKECIWTVPSPQCSTKLPQIPTISPSNNPSITPTKNPSETLTINPSFYPSKSPTKYPTYYPSEFPSNDPSVSPTKSPSSNPSTINPSFSPTFNPSKTPTKYPSKTPSNNPSNPPTNSPSKIPTFSPSENPTKSPSLLPTNTPSKAPTARPTRSPTIRPTITPSNYPTNIPTQNPSTPSPTDAIGQVQLLERKVHDDNNLVKKNEFDQNENTFDNKSDNTIVIIGATIGGAICCFLIVFMVCYLRSRKKDSYRSYDRGYGTEASETETDSVIANESSVDSFNMDDNKEREQFV